MSWNKAAEKLLGYPRGEVVHRTIGPLGTRVCDQHCSVAECVGGSNERRQLLEEIDFHHQKEALVFGQHQSNM